MKGVVALVCSNCGTELDGLNSDVVFFCNSCHHAYECSAKGLKQYPVKYMTPGDDAPKPDLYIPFWELDISIDVNPTLDASPKHGFGRAERARKLKRLNGLTEKIVNGWKKAFVPAARLVRPSYYGDPGFLHSTNQKISAAIRPERPYRDLKLFGASRRLVDAVRYPKLYALLFIDRAVDVTNLDLEVRFHAAQIVGIPFARAGDRAIDCITIKDYPNILFNDWALLLEKAAA